MVDWPPYPKGFTEGTATGAEDFYNILTAFLQYTPVYPFVPSLWPVNLVSGGDPLTPFYDYLFKASGFSDNTPAAYAGLRLHHDSINDRYVLQFVGALGMIYAQPNFNGHENCTPAVMQIFLPDGAFDYKIIINGRRFIVLVTDGTKWQCMYVGLLLQYAMPSDYPIPLFVGGTSSQGSGVESFDDESEYHTLFSHAKYDGSIEPQAYVLTPDKVWRRCADNTGDGPLADCAIGPDYYGSLPQFDESPDTGFAYQTIKNNMTTPFGGAPLLTPMTVVQNLPVQQTLGILQSVFHVTGGNVGDMVTVNGINHLIIPNVFRAGQGENIAIGLE